jgi:hypothetical protein
VAQYFPLKVLWTGEEFPEEFPRDRLESPGRIGGSVEPFTASKVNPYA